MKFLGSAALILAATPAIADPSYDWGGSSAALVAGPGHPLAYVDCVNELTTTTGELDFALNLGGFVVVMKVQQRNGDLPDLYIAHPPEGYIAVPRSILIEEGSKARISIFSTEGTGA